MLLSAVSMGGSNEFVECFCGGAVAEGGSGAVVEFVGDGVEVGLVAGDGGSFGQVAADEPVGVFVCSSLPGAVGVSEEHLHAGVVGEALVAGHFPALVPGQCAHRLVGKALDAAGERVTDLVGFPTQRQGDDDQVAGGALDQGRARAGPVLADDQVAFPVAGIFRSAMSGRFDQLVASQQLGFCVRLLGVSCASTCARVSICRAR